MTLDPNGQDHLARRLYSLASRVSKGRLDEREYTYLDAVVTHYNTTTLQWKKTQP